MKEPFGALPSGGQASLYTISCGCITAKVTDYGAHLVSVLVPDREGRMADVVLGFDDANGYRLGNGGCLGATIGRNANRLKDSCFELNGRQISLTPTEGPNNLHSGPDHLYLRLWQVERHTENSLTLRLDSHDGDQGFPGNAVIRVTYCVDASGGLCITYDAVCDKDTVFNMTNHSYFNLAGHDQGRAMEQVLMIPGRFFTPDDASNIPTGELRSVEGTPFDFRTPKPLGRDIGADYEPLHLQGGYDHNFEVFCNPCAVLSDPASGRSMAVYTDCPGIQLYTGNFLDETGKGGFYYGKRSGVALETQFYPDALHHADWPQPITRAGQHYHSQTRYQFSAE